MKKVICTILTLVITLTTPLSAFGAQYDIYDEYGNVIWTVETPDTAPSISAALTNENWLKLTWNLDDWSTYYDGFQLLKYNPKSDTYTEIAKTTKTEYRVKDLKPATVYYFAVRTYVLYEDEYYFGAQSKTVSAATAPIAAKVKSVKYKGTGKIRVSFRKSKKMSGYNLQYSTHKKFKPGYTTNLMLGRKKKACTVKNLGKKTYYVRIRPYKEVNGVKYFGKWSNVKSKTVKNGVTLEKMINSTKTDLSGRKKIKKLTDGKVDIRKYKTTYDRIRAIYKWHAVHGLEFEHCLACNSNFNECLYYLYGDSRKYDAFIWIDAGNFKNRDGSLAVHKWSVLYYSGIPFIFDPRLQSYTKDYNGTLYFGVERGTPLQKRYKHEGWYLYWGVSPNFEYDDTIIKYHK